MRREIAGHLPLHSLCASRQLCSSWRDEVISATRLWSSLLVDFNTRRIKDGPRHRLYLKTLVEYSTPLPLDLRVFSIEEDDKEELEWVLVQNIGRIRILKLQFAPNEWDDESDPTEPYGINTLTRFLAAITQPAPQLETLELLGYAPGQAPIEIPETLFGGHAPRLRHLTLDLTFDYEHICPALGAVTSLATSPSSWDYGSIASYFPRLRQLFLCGSPATVIPNDGWSNLDTLGLALRLLNGDHDDELKADLKALIASARSRIECIFINSLQPDEILMDHIICSDAYGVTITRGGFDFGSLDGDGRFAAGLAVEVQAKDGTAFTVVAGRVGDESISILPFLARLGGIKSLTICESIYGALRDCDNPLTFPTLTELTIYVLPTVQRASSRLFDFETDALVRPLWRRHETERHYEDMGSKSSSPTSTYESDSPDLSSISELGTNHPFIVARNLKTLTFSSHPSFPVWSCGWFITEWREDQLVTELREISADDITTFISHDIAFDGERLQEVVLGSSVFLAEGLYSGTKKLKEVAESVTSH